MVCIALYSLLHWTYGPDARKARHNFMRVDDIASDETQLADLSLSSMFLDIVPVHVLEDLGFIS
jgi:hypothetical protein